MSRDRERTDAQSGMTCGCTGHAPHSRRAMLGMLGAASLAGPTRAAPATPLATIDVHHHYVPPQIIAQGPPVAARAAVDGWSPARAIEDMDKAGVRLSMLSYSSPYLWHAGVEPGRRLARLCNDYSATLAKDHPGRFGVFAGLPDLTDTEGCLKEMEYALGDLGADGVTVMTGYGDKWLGDPAFDPVWRELDRRKAVVFVHPRIPGCCAATLPDTSPAYAELPFDTARAGLNLWRTGTAARFPNIRLILSHGGGALPMIADRIDKMGRPGSAQGELVHDGNATFRKFYYDTATVGNSPALAAVMAIAGPQHVLYGSDYPYAPMDRGVHDLVTAKLPAKVAMAIHRGNAQALMPRLRA